MATSKKIVSIFCGNFASVTEQDELKVVVCSNCKRETELDTYQERNGPVGQGFSPVSSSGL